MRFFVYYQDDYYENGGIGLSCHEDKESALAFIHERLSLNKTNTLDHYTLIEGKMLTLKAVEYVTKVEA